MPYFESINKSYNEGDRVSRDNINENDIIKLKCNNKQIYCRVTGTTQTMVKVEGLDIENLDECVRFTINPTINNIHKNYLGFGRNMCILTNIKLINKI